MKREMNKIFKKKSDRRGQMMLEYTVVIGAIVLIIFAMTPLIRRGFQSVIKTTADQVGVQTDADQITLREGEDLEEKIRKEGFLTSSTTTTTVLVNSVTQEEEGETTYFYDDTITSNAETNLGLGFNEGE